MSKYAIDDLELQRLLDGRLTAAERSAFFDCLDDDPQKWKAVTLAFLEEQLLRSELRAMAAGESPAAVEPARRRRDGWQWWMTQAAVMTFVLTIGMLLGRSPFFAKTNADEVAGPRTAPTASPQTNPERGDYYVVLTPPDQPAPPDPIESMMTPVLDQRVRKLVQDHGYRVSEEPVIYVIEDKKGDRYLIPQRNVSFIPEKK